MPKKLQNLHQNSSLTNLKYSAKTWRRSVLDQKLLNGQHQLLSGRPSWIFQNNECTGSIMICAQIFGAHSCTLIRDFWYNLKFQSVFSKCSAVLVCEVNYCLYVNFGITLSFRTCFQSAQQFVFCEVINCFNMFGLQL